MKKGECIYAIQGFKREGEVARPPLLYKGGMRLN